MALSQSEYIERIVIALNPDGSIKGAYSQSLHTVSDGDIVLSAKQGGAMPLNPDTLQDIFSGALMLAQISALQKSITELTEQKSLAEEQRDAALARIGEMTEPSGFAPLSPVQLRLGLMASGVSPSAVVAAIEAIPDPEARESAMTYWDYSLSYRREHPLIASLGAALGLSSDDIDDMWSHAETLS